MVHSQTIHHSLFDPIKEGGMPGIKHLPVLHSETNQIVDGKKSAVIDFLLRFLPVTKQIVLILDQLLENIGSTFNTIGYFYKKTRDISTFSDKGGQLHFNRLPWTI